MVSKFSLELCHCIIIQIRIDVKWSWNATYESNTNVYFDSFRVIQGQNIYPSGTTFTPALHQNYTIYN